MKKVLILTWSLTGLLFLASCSDDDDNVTQTPEDLGLKSEYTVDRLRILDIDLNTVSYPNAEFEWTIKSKTTQEDSLTSTGKDFSFISLYSGTYSVTLKVKNGGETIEKQTYITVEKETGSYSPYIAKVYDFLPAIGQFTNDLPKWAEGDTRESMIAKASVITGSSPGTISLGGYGGYVVFGFDHSIINIQGERDFKIRGNAFWADATPGQKAGNCEPGIILVSYDKNKNGIPDDEWYEIAGSEYHKSETIKNYELIYHKPDPNATPVPGAEGWQTDIQYIRWTDNQGNTGYKTKNSYHKQSYYPEWVSSPTLSFTGTKLADNYIDQSGNGTYWTGKSYEYGYADNAPNNDEASNIDISWAVDKNGTPVKLAGIDFVKVYTGTNQEAGWLGEVSTEVNGGYDLHIIN
ncbi:MAG: cell surface protein [Flavobacteriaceae bacterium]|nr:cell surface protein [Flavobacteriaceae bacterium]